MTIAVTRATAIDRLPVGVSGSYGRREVVSKIRPTGRVIDPWPWPTYRVEFVRAELERYERDHREIYDEVCSVYVPNRDGLVGRAAELSPSGNAGIPYRDGLLRTLGWFLDMNRSPLFDHPSPPTKETCSAEYRAAYYMTEDSANLVFGVPLAVTYGDFNPHYVTAVYRTLDWVTAMPSCREQGYLDDPLPF